jgi:hypothetical protein
VGRVIVGAVAGLVAIIVLIAMAAAGAVSSLFADPAGGGGPLCLGIVNDDSLDAAPAGLTPEQAGNAAIIISVGQQWEVPQRGWVIATATAFQESNLVNLGDLGEDNDHDSLGLFQQRPSRTTSGSGAAGRAGRQLRQLVRATPALRDPPRTVGSRRQRYQPDPAHGRPGCRPELNRARAGSHRKWRFLKWIDAHLALAPYR